jgi:hypothetical protein
MTDPLANIRELLAYLTPEERAQVDELLTVDAPIWTPLAGPQTMAYESEADIIGYGGAAGGGKTDLMCGMALTHHTVSAIFRREATQLTGIIDRLTAMLGSTVGFNGQQKIWRLPGRQIEFGSTPYAGDELKYQGRPKDFLGLDEATNFLEAQARFLMGWVRTTIAGQRCRTLMTFNPPTTAEGQWVLQFFAPWLVDEHPNPAKPGELRWYAAIDGRDVEVDGPGVVEHKGERITPLSRTFIPSRITDNPFLMETGYVATLQSLPEPLRSQMLQGDFRAGMQDDPWQVIPSAWVLDAQKRWQPKDAKGPMDAMGVDVSRGGRDETIIARRHATWFDELISKQGTASPDGPTVAAEVLKERRDRAVVHIDMVGWGSSPYDFLVTNRVQTVGVNGAAGSFEVSREGGLRFVNLRAELWWRMRETLDPKNPEPIALPPDPKLRADLSAPKWKLTHRGIQVELKEEIIKRIGRSPDRGDAVCLANLTTPKTESLPGQGRMLVHEYDPLEAQ